MGGPGQIVNVADLVEDNGKTVRENNLEKKHNIPIGALVEVKYEKWHGEGACEIIHARLWVISHDRDCDATPLYSLCQSKNGFTPWMEEGATEFLAKMLAGVESGFPEESLTVVEVTPELVEGEGQLKWPEEE